jgi:hypothetical protein
MSDTQALPAVRGAPADRRLRAARPATVRWLAAATWAGGSLALAALYLRISLGSRVISDGANNALQGLGLLHGHLLLHGWQIGDANFYFLELPLNALTEALFGLGDFAAHAASALTYAFATMCAVALAATGSRGPARVARRAVVLMVLAAPLSVKYTYLVLEEPDHIGTTVFMLGSFLLIDRAPARRFTPPLLLLILSAGQFSDLTVRYVAVPAVMLACGYRALAARGLRSPDALLVGAAAASVPLSALMAAVSSYLGGFSMAATRGQIAPVGSWPHHAMVTLMNLRILFGAVAAPDTVLGMPRIAFGLICLLAAVCGLAWLAWVWRRASRAEQMLGVAVVFNLGTYAISTFAVRGNVHELVGVLPCTAVLAARALVPARIIAARAAFATATVAALAAVAPLAFAAARPIDRPATAPLTTWLEAHGLTYGLAGYWDGAAATLQSGDKVRLRPVHPGAKSVGRAHFEVNSSWYDPSRNDARFVVADPSQKYPPAAFERIFGKPAATYRLDGWVILVYRTNLLRLLTR